ALVVSRIPRHSVRAARGPVRDRLLLLGDSHEMHAAVDEDGIAGYRTREVARQKHSNIADLLLGHISAEGRRLLGQLAQFADALHRADVQGEGVAAAGNLWERAREILAGGKRDAVRDGVQAAPAVLQAGKDGLDLLVVLHIARERGKRSVSADGVEQGVEVLFQPLAL